MRIKATAALLSILAITACEAPRKDPQNFQYWQRSSASSAIYMQGPKAQQALHRDIARCVSEVRELEHLEQTRNALRTNPHTGKMEDPDVKRLQGYDTPEYNDYLLSEHKDYHDFDSCMAYKGWERTQYVPYEISDRARDNYLRSIKDYSYQSRYGTQDQPKAPQTGGEGLNTE